jgi:hypothetical protein
MHGVTSRPRALYRVRNSRHLTLMAYINYA